jgi:hypothetical protein
VAGYQCSGNQHGPRAAGDTTAELEFDCRQGKESNFSTEPKTGFGAHTADSFSGGGG